MNYLAIPGLKNFKVFGKADAKLGYKKKYIVTVLPKRGIVIFWNGAVESMCLKAGNSVGFLNIDEYMFAYKSQSGTKVVSSVSRNLKTENRSLGNFLTEAFVKEHLPTNKKVRFYLKETSVEFEGNKLFEIMLSPRYQHALSKYSSNKFEKIYSKTNY